MKPLASIGSMSRVNLRLIVLPICVLLAAFVAAGCGGDSKPDPSISSNAAETLQGTLKEVQDNVDVGSCQVAADKAGELKDEVAALPPTVDDDVTQALENATDQLLILIDDPDQCDRPDETTTTEETTTEEDTTTEETTTEETTTEETQPTTTTPPTTTTQPPSNGGGVGPPSGGGGGL
jgi:cell division protein FtsN